MWQRYKRIGVCFLLVMFTTYYVDITFFQHSHIINGVTIVHSHFHGKAHAQSGAHGVNELTLISTLSDFQSEQMGEVCIAFSFFLLLCMVGGAIPADDIRLRPSFHVLLRAPPSFF